MKKPIMLISNDQHLDQNNLDTVKRLLLFQIKKAKELDLSHIVVLGDMFDVRGSQKLDVMILFLEILDKCFEEDIKMIAIAGNHDKAKYDSFNSWLTVFRNHPALDLIEDIDVMDFSGISVTLMPFFIEPMMVERIKEAKPTDLFLGHLEMNGSVNNGVKMKGCHISAGMFKQFKKILLGHYHNSHQIGKADIYHLPSLYQRNFGEDSIKGYTIIYDDLSHEHIQSDFRVFETISVEIDELTPKFTKELLKLAKSDLSLRISLSGSTEKLKAFKRDKFLQAGIDVKIKYEEFVVDESVTETPKAEKITRDNVVVRFDSFCERDGLDKEKGMKYLNKVIENR